MDRSKGKSLNGILNEGLLLRGFDLMAESIGCTPWQNGENNAGQIAIVAAEYPH
jgi:hypothetical protein